MGVISNFNVYGLMIIPVAMMIRGHQLHIQKMVMACVVCVTLQMTQPVLTDMFRTIPPAQWVMEGVVVPLVQASFFHFALNDSKAKKTLRLFEGGDGDMPAALATVWCLMYTVFFRWFGWYRTMASLGYEPENFLAGAEAFLQLITTLAAGRRLQGHGSGAVWAVVAAYAVGEVVRVALPSMPLAGSVVTMAAMLGLSTVLPTRTAEDGRVADKKSS